MNPKTILVADDEASTAEILGFLLEGEGYRVLTAFNGRDGLDKLRLSPIDLVVLDVMMPIMSGAEMAKAMQADSSTASIPILVTTALPESTVRSMVGRFDGYLRKPCLKEEVVSAVRALLSDEAKPA